MWTSSGVLECKELLSELKIFIYNVIECKNTFLQTFAVDKKASSIYVLMLSERSGGHWGAQQRTFTILTLMSVCDIRQQRGDNDMLNKALGQHIDV